MKKSISMSSLIAGILLLLQACTKEEVKPEPIQQQEPPHPTAGLPKIVINEFMASNQSSIQDSKGKHEDWIEIYNADVKAVNIGGLFLSDNKENKTKYRIPATDSAATTIQPGGFLILWADSNLDEGVLHLDFKLSGEGEDLGIYAADGKVIDEITYGPQVTDVSMGRLNKGGNTWVTFTQPTPGTANPEFQ